MNFNLDLIHKIIFYLKLGLKEFLKKIVFLFGMITFQSLLKLLRKIRLLFYFKSFNIDCGSNITIHAYSLNVEIGKNLVIKENAVFEFARDSKLKIDNHCFLSYGVLICCNKSIQIGDYVQIGEYTSIRDTTHNYSNLNIPIKKQGDISLDIIIGNDVWIGRGCIIMPGTIIEDGVVIGANSVVKGRLETNCIYAGTPAKLIKQR